MGVFTNGYKQLFCYQSVYSTFYISTSFQLSSDAPAATLLHVQNYRLWHFSPPKNVFDMCHLFYTRHCFHCSLVTKHIFKRSEYSFFFEQQSVRLCCGSEHYNTLMLCQIDNVPIHSILAWYNLIHNLFLNV